MKLSIDKVVLVRGKSEEYDLPSEYIRSLKDEARALEEIFGLSSEPQEVFVALFLNYQRKIVGAAEISRGNMHHAQAPIQQVLQHALAHNASGIIIAHNHPSGVVIPSKSDTKTTNAMFRACRTVGLCLMDHAIIGGGNFFSFWALRCEKKRHPHMRFLELVKRSIHSIRQKKFEKPKDILAVVAESEKG